MNLTLERFSYSSTETEGVLTLPDGQEFATIEKPWNGNQAFVSCIPEGTYEINWFTRANGDVVPCLTNHDLDVYRTEAEVDGLGRYAILMHVGNWASSVVGCIAPGMKRTPMYDKKTGKLEQAVAQSGRAMKAIIAALEEDEINMITITRRAV